MDESDLAIIKLLMFNSRLPYREIAGHVGLTLNAVYKRVQNLVDMGVIRRFTATINAHTLGAIYAFIYGESQAQDIDKVIKTLQQNENIIQIMLSSRNYIYTGSFLKNVHELGTFSSYISQAAQIQSPAVGLREYSYYKCPISYILPKSRSLNIDKLDLAIIRALHKDSRKPTSEVAEDVGSTPSTVRRRLTRLIEEGLVELSIEFYPEASKDIYSFFLVKLNPTTDKIQLARQVVEKYHPSVFFCWSFSNLPNMLLFFVWTNTIEQLNNLLDKIKKEEIESVATDIMRKGWFLDSWKEDLLYSENPP